MSLPSIPEFPSPEGRGDGRPALIAEGITKRYGGAHALRGASIEVRAGEIHGLIGENGSGKSTLLGILSGQTLADSGRIQLGGKPLKHGDRRTLRRQVAVVTQELSLAPDLTVAENIMMARDKPRRWYGINWRDLNARAAEALARLDLDINPETPLRNLRIDQQQLVEIAKAVQLRHPILVLDEPTSSLTDDAVAALAATMRRLRDSDVAIVFVSHRLDEFFSLADHVTVLRDGRRVASRPICEYTRESLVEDMLGYAVEQYAHADRERIQATEPRLRVHRLCVPGSVDNVELEVHPGEVVGLVGLEGAGRSELLEAIFGARPTASGSVVIGGGTSIPKSPVKAMRRGLALVPADRKTDGLLMDMSITANINLAARVGGLRLRSVNRRQEARATRQASEALQLQRGPNSRLAGELSGGNQQKVLLGKWLQTKPRVLLLDEPTRGVDVGAKREIHQLIAQIRDEGVGVLCSSSDLEELLAVADRFVVMFRGRVVGRLPREEATEARLSHLSTGGMS
jgi:ABC-type sugar transport system ATPase subunit